MEELEALIHKAQSPEVQQRQRYEAFSQLVEQFQDLAYRYAFAVLGDAQLAQDVVQEAFITAYDKLDQLRESKAFPHWLKRIVLTHCNRLRRGKQLPLDPFEEMKDIAAAEPDPLNVVELGDLKEKVRAAIAALPDHERVVVRLFYLQEQSVKEVAWRLQLPETTVKKRLQYAREHMRENIIEMHGVSLMACQMQSVNVDGSLIILMLALLQRSYVSFRR